MQSRPSNGRQSINLVRAWSRLTPLETPLNPDQLMNISRHPITLETEDCALSPSVDLTMQSCCLGLSRSYSSEHTMLRAGFRGSTPSRVVRGGSKRQIRLPRTHSPFPDNLQLMVAHHSFASERIDLLKPAAAAEGDVEQRHTAFGSSPPPAAESAQCILRNMVFSIFHLLLSVALRMSHTKASKCDLNDPSQIFYQLHGLTSEVGHIKFYDRARHCAMVPDKFTGLPEDAVYVPIAAW
ncbi:hypothetical protein M514_02519 [Trichuris suis]|uniref:Uncharacterized protein n=1 Tax=Trichuris suis TaxID=68888 RepID=A0A085MGR9_9BILA|nr:hypothetical protein M513_02519 [Trichuris suis]KFD70943.1 hypothetical protein M514_02519 [Trichuris suis]